MHADAEIPDLDLDLTLVTDLPLPESLTEASLHSLIVHALGSEGASGHWEVSVSIITDAVIQEMHLVFMGLDSPTDVMTFPYEPESPAPGGTQGGDIVISADTAALNAPDACWSLGEELEFLVLHGILHLLGWDDRESTQRSRMLERQSALLAGWRTGIA